MAPTQPVPRLAAKIADVCRRHPVVLVYLFGSHARGDADSESDVDLAVLVDASLTPLQRHRLRLRLLRDAADALDLPLEHLDVVTLQDVPVLLQYNVLRTGQLLFAKTPAARQAFERSVEQRYEDVRPYLEREAELTLQRILSRPA